jgi:hypothetical protein
MKDSAIALARLAFEVGVDDVVEASEVLIPLIGILPSE